MRRFAAARSIDCALGRVDLEAARTLLTELQQVQPSRPEATQALSDLALTTQ